MEDLFRPSPPSLCRGEPNKDVLPHVAKGSISCEHEGFNCSGNEYNNLFKSFIFLFPRKVERKTQRDDTR